MISLQPSNLYFCPLFFSFIALLLFDQSKPYMFLTVLGFTKPNQFWSLEPSPIFTQSTYIFVFFFSFIELLLFPRKMIPTLIDRKKIEFNTVPLFAGLLFFKGKTDES